MSKITKPQAMKALEAVVAEKGAGHQYEVRANTQHKQQSGALDYSYDDCIAGCAIRILDPELHEKLMQYERDNQRSFTLAEVIDADFSEIGEDLAVEIEESFTAPALLALAAAQRIQDRNGTWGLAVQNAREGVL